MRLARHVQRLRREESGFSLIEMLAAMAILLTIVGTLTTLMVSATSSEVDLTMRVRAQQEARLAVEAMRRDVHCASAITVTSFASVTLTLPAGCPSAIGGTTFTWCTSGSGSRFALRRIVGAPLPGTCTGGRVAADYLTTANVFAMDQDMGKLNKLCVDFPVDLDVADARRTYRLRDQLVLRNSTRNTADGTSC